MVDTKDQSNAIVYAMLFVNTVDTGVCVMRCENSVYNVYSVYNGLK